MKERLTGYYQVKTKAQNIIKQMAIKGVSVSQIQMYIEENFGFGTNFTNNWLEKLELNGWIIVKGDTITAREQEPEKDDAEKQAEDEADEILKK